MDGILEIEAIGLKTGGHIMEDTYIHRKHLAIWQLEYSLHPWSLIEFTFRMIEKEFRYIGIDENEICYSIRLKKD